MGSATRLQDHVTQAVINDWPQPEGVRECLRGQLLVPWSRPEVVSVLENEWNGTWASGTNEVVPVLWTARGVG